MREKKISGFLFPASANVEAWDEFALRFYSRDDPHNESPPAETESTAPRSALRERTGILLSTRIARTLGRRGCRITRFHCSPLVFCGSTDRSGWLADWAPLLQVDTNHELTLLRVVRDCADGLSEC